jgi:putative transcriptional regulator
MTKVNTKQYNRIKVVLEEKGISQTALAEKLNKTFISVNRYANNVNQPSIETLFDIAKVLKVNPKELINS